MSEEQKRPMAKGGIVPAGCGLPLIWHDGSYLIPTREFRRFSRIQSSRLERINKGELSDPKINLQINQTNLKVLEQLKEAVLK